MFYKNNFKNSEPHIIVSYKPQFTFQNLNVKISNKRNTFTNTKNDDPLIQIALFLDDVAIEKLTTGISETGTNIEEMLGFYMNNIQSIYNHPSLGTHINFEITGIYKTSTNFDTSLPENNAHPLVINHFCSDIMQHVKSGNPKTWDIAILITGLKVIDRTNPIILGHASGSICSERSCVAVRIGGMNLAHALAHEIGHM